MKTIDLKKTIFELTEQYPELIDILKDLGFLGVRNPVTRNTLGRITTIPQGCEKISINLDEVIKSLKDKGFLVSK